MYEKSSKTFVKTLSPIRTRSLKSHIGFISSDVASPHPYKPQSVKTVSSSDNAIYQEQPLCSEPRSPSYVAAQLSFQRFLYR
ncbi:hypothetical protein GEMRC1_001023 [Eukaryota sp. GEM-RC1]